MPNRATWMGPGVIKVFMQLAVRPCKELVYIYIYVYIHIYGHCGGLMVVLGPFKS